MRESNYSALFVDLVLPGMTGVDVLREALACAPRRPAVLMSGHDASHGDVLTALTLGPVTFVQKPISKERLTSSLDLFRALLPGVVSRR